MSNTRLASEGSHPAIAAPMPCIMVERHIPLPPPVKYSHYPLESMAVGNSFFLKTGRNGVAESRVRSAARGYAKRHKKRFTCRIVSEGGVRGIRVWRVA